MRSDHAAPDALPRVELELTVSRRRLRLARSPEFQRRKRRGTGCTTVPASVSLSERVDGQWKTLSSRADEVGAVVRDVVGLGLEQFAKVVLLPQGSFADFLRATPEFRRELLERLFDVSRFTDVEDSLALRRRQAAADLAQAQALLTTEQARVTDVLGHLDDPALAVPRWDELPLAQVRPALEGLAGQVNELAANALVERDAAEARERLLQAAHSDAVRMTGCRDRGEQARAVLAALDGRASDLHTAADALAAGRRAASVAGDLRAVADANARTAVARRRTAVAAAVVADLGLGTRTGAAAARVDGDAASARAVVEVIAALDGCLVQAEHLQVAFGQAQERLGKQSTVHRAAQRRHAEAVAEVDCLRHAMTELAERQEAAAKQASCLSTLNQEVDDLRGRLRCREDLDGREQLLRQARAEEQDASHAHLDARMRWADVRQAQLDGMAARLSAELIDGSACPVCGSVEHPAPADLADLVPESAVAAAENEVTAARERLSNAQTRAAGLHGEVTARTALLDGDEREARTLATLVAAAVARGEEAAGATSHLSALAEDLKAAGTELAEAQQRRDRAGSDLDAVTGRLDVMQAESDRAERALRKRLLRHAQDCPCATGPVDVLPQVQARHRSVAAALEDLCRALEALAEAAEHESRASADVAERLSEQGFGSVAEAQQALLPPDVLTASEQLLAEAERERVQAQTVLSDPEVGTALAGPPPDVKALSTSLASARQARQHADRRHAVVELSARELTRLAGQASEAARLVAARTREHATTTRLADAVCGLGPDNTLRMRLSSFVLAARLERVVELANERLANLGDGRYRLRHSDARAPGAGRSGLGLQVEDLWTGQARDTATLSGGESFMASLALALGLADAVREEAGGFDLQTLFVDEGFGTLDENSLEQVLGVLDQLRDGGRSVGVVSHVPDLRSRIPFQLRVHKTPNGSTVHLASASVGAA